jgi:hypothetical protein
MRPRVQPGLTRLTVAVATAVLALMWALPAWAATGTIVAFGDSVPAGYNLAALPHPTAFDTACSRSAEAPVYTTAARLGLAAHNVACADAVSWNVGSRSQARGGQTMPAQVEQARALGAVSVAQVIVTANDVQWVPMFISCLGPADCNNPVNTAVFRYYLMDAERGLRDALGKIESLHPATVEVGGYYDLFAGNMGLTPSQLGFNAGEVQWYQARRAELNGMIERVTREFANGRYVPIHFEGHAGKLVCSPWEACKLHPTRLGASVIGEQMAAAITA